MMNPPRSVAQNVHEKIAGLLDWSPRIRQARPVSFVALIGLVSQPYSTLVPTLKTEFNLLAEGSFTYIASSDAVYTF